MRSHDIAVSLISKACLVPEVTVDSVATRWEIYWTASDKYDYTHSLFCLLLNLLTLEFVGF